MAAIFGFIDPKSVFLSPISKVKIQAILMQQIHRYEGTINQFTGDGVMALFGAPIAHEDHAQRACRAALAIQNVIGQYGKKIKKNWGIEFKLRVGLNSGLVTWMFVSSQVFAPIPA